MRPEGALDRVVAALAELAALDDLVLVPASRPIRDLWSRDGHSGTSPSRSVTDDLVAAARGHLGRDDPRPALELANAFGPVISTADGSSDALLLAVRRDGAAWTDEDRIAVRLAARVLRDELRELAEHPRPNRSAHGAADLEKRMRSAVDARQFSLEYQPEVDMRSGEILAVEALVRWNHPEHGQLPPDSFIEFAEQSDVIKILGTWIIATAIGEFAAWNTSEIVLRVNVSPAQLTGAGVVDDFAAALKEHRLDGHRVCVEFTETAAGSGTEELARTLGALHELGIASAIDDLATGYSTLSRLRSLPVDSIKIDRSLVSGIAGDPRARAIVRALVALAGDLGLEVIAEGIENGDDVSTLLELGCYRGQGHYFYRADGAAATAHLLHVK